MPPPCARLSYSCFLSLLLLIYVGVLQCGKPVEQLLLLYGDVVTLRGMPYAEDLGAPLPQVLDRLQNAGRRLPRR